MEGGQGGETTTTTIVASTATVTNSFSCWTKESIWKDIFYGWINIVVPCFWLQHLLQVTITIWLLKHFRFSQTISREYPRNNPGFSPLILMDLLSIHLVWRSLWRICDEEDQLLLKSFFLSFSVKLTVKLKTQPIFAKYNNQQ